MSLNLAAWAERDVDGVIETTHIRLLQTPTKITVGIMGDKGTVSGKEAISALSSYLDWAKKEITDLKDFKDHKKYIESYYKRPGLMVGLI